VRAGFYAGDPSLVHYLMELRKHAGLMPPGPVQAAGAVALADDAHVDIQRERYRERLQFLANVLTEIGIPTTMPGGSFYLWPEAPDGDAWALTEFLAAKGGALVSPGEFYGQSGAGHVRIAVVQPLDRLELVARRLTSA
jgi:aspartate/methionine/tyrosine aminotransferase